jgi:hypothetical protein
VSFVVSGIGSSLADISLSMTLDHTWAGDLDVVLTAPLNAASLVIYSRIGATTAASFGDSSNFNGTYVFNNSTANSIWAVAGGGDTSFVITPQAYRTSVAGPTGSPAAATDFTAAFSALTPAQINGTWRLSFRDGAATDTGSVTGAALTLLEVPIGPSLSYTPAAGATSGTGGPVNFIGVTGPGSTGTGTIVATPSDGAGGLTTTLDNFTLSGTNAADFDVTNAATLTFTDGDNTPQNITMTCDAGSTVRTANLQATETIDGGATTQRFWVLNCPAGSVGPAQDGDVTLTGTFALNSYTNLNGAASAGATSLTVTSAAALTLPTCGAGCSTTGATTGNGLGTVLAPSDLLMIYQPQELGGTITTTNSPDFGAVSGTGYGSAGIYEFVYVSAISGNTISIDTSAGANCTGLKRSYDSGAMVIRVPQLRNLTINSGGVLQPASAWNGSTGGVIALDVRPGAPLDDANGTIAINGTGRIDASGFGFRPGVVDNLTFGANTNATNTTMNFYVTDSCLAGARKGESILGWAGDNNGGTCGATASNNETGSYGTGAFSRGALANGGGGGNSHNAGGGGGANGGDVASWNGGGNPVSGFDAAWALDNTEAGNLDLPTVTASSTSSGGGRGGYSFNSAAGNAATTGPSVGSWGGDNRKNRGGLGGRPLDRRPDSDTVDRLYFGGGGGAGDGNNGASAPGGAGGGLIFLIARRIVSDVAVSTPLILANGANGETTLPNGNDGPGGGGGGGTIVALVNQQISNNLNFSVVGGTGGNQTLLAFFATEGEGPGGGGGGGVVAASWGAGAPTTTLAGGNNGVTDSGAMTEFTPNGATRGGAGLLTSAPPRNSAPFLCLQDGGDFTTPVTNAYFSSARSNGRLNVQFSTSAEVGNLGFQIYGEAAARRVRIGELILSRDIDNPLPQDYSVSLDDQQYERLYLADISVAGKEVVRGPFQIGTSYGARPVISPYDWSAAQAELAAHSVSRSASAGSVAYLRVAERGMHRITHEALQAVGLDLTSVPAAEIAIIGRDGPVVRRVRGNAVFGAGSSIEFFGDPTPDLYSRTETYLVRRDPSNARDMQLAQPVLLPAGPQSQQWATVRFAPETRYGFASPTPDPWYAARIVANGGPASYDFPIDAAGAISSSGVLKVNLWGGINYPAGALPDHHVRVHLNGVLVADVRFDGFIPWNGEIAVDNLVAGVNTVRLEMPRDTGNPADLVNLDSIEIDYMRMPAFASGRLYGAGMRPSAISSDLLFEDGIGDAVSGPPALEFETVTLPGLGSSTRNFRIDAGIPVELEVALGRSIDAGSLGATSEIWMSEPGGLLQPTVSLAPDFAPIEGTPSNYWVITHGMFASSLQPLLALRQQQGLGTRLVDVEQIYLEYSAGNPDPQAIARFVKEVAAPAGAQYLLLVGGDTYDAPGYLNSGSISFIPTIYQRTNEIVAFAPADPLFGDLTGDGISEISVGRLPVRTAAEATEAVRKILAYDAQPATNRLLSVAGAADTGQSISFRDASAAFQSALPWGWTQSSVYVDTLGVSAAQAAVIAGFNSGQSLVSYVGHSSPTQWGFEQVLTSAQVPTLAENANAPLVLQFGCWTTYFVIPTANSMSHALMLTQLRGASGVLGSTVLLDQPSHDLMAAAIGPKLIAGRRFGDVILEAKREVASRLHGELEGAEVFVGISLMGDPAQQIR